MKEERTPYHRLFCDYMKNIFIPLDLKVETNYPIMKGSPELDVLIINDKKKWTKEQLQYLPDGLRDSTSIHNILELKYTQSVNYKSLCQSITYHVGHLNTGKLDRSEIKTFLISSKTPLEKTIKKFGFTIKLYNGIYESTNILAENITLIVLNELDDHPHNMMMKLFASRKKTKFSALNFLLKQGSSQLPENIRSIIIKTINYWRIIGGYTMEEIQNSVTEEDRAMIADFAVNFATIEERLAGLNPEERLAGLNPEEIFKLYNPEERVAGLNPKEIIGCFDREELKRLLNEEE